MDAPRVSRSRTNHWNVRRSTSGTTAYAMAARASARGTTKRNESGMELPAIPQQNLRPPEENANRRARPVAGRRLGRRDYLGERSDGGVGLASRRELGQVAGKRLGGLQAELSDALHLPDEI